MARFVFKLEAVLRQRKQIEQQKLRDLAVRQQVVVGLQQNLLALQTQANDAAKDLRDNRLVGPINLSYLSAHRRYIMSMGRQAVAIAQKVAQAQKFVDEARLALAEAAKNRKAIEKLKEKHYESWRQEQAKKEADALDEVGMNLAFEAFAGDDA